MVQFVYPDGDGNVRALFGVFDGHSTKAAAQFSSAELPGFIERRLRVLDVQERKLRTVDAPSGSFAKFFEQRSKLVKEALAAAFLDADRFFLSESVVLHLINGGQRQSLERCFSGACALVALIDRDTLYIANAGDCRAVIGVEVTVDGHDEENFDTFLHYPDGTKTAIIASVLSSDHNTDNHREIARIRAEKPVEIDLFVGGRLKGILKPTRHIGGALMKEPIAKRFIRNDTLTEDWNPPYTTATPEVTHRTLTSSDRFIIMGSDGLWDLLSSQEAVSLVVEYDHLKREKAIPAELNVCTFIIERALSRASLSLQAYANTNPSTSHQPTSSHLNEQNGDSKSSEEIFETSGEISSQNGNNSQTGNSTETFENGHSSGNLESISNQPQSSDLSDSSVLDPTNTSKDTAEKSEELSELERLCTILSLPAHQRRDVYDDISVTVVYLDSGRREQAGTAMGQLANWPCPSFPSSVDRIAKLRKALPLAKGPLGRLLATNTSEAKDIKQYLEECWPDRHLDRWTAQSLTTRKFLKSFGIELAPSNTPLHPSAAKQHQLRDSSFDITAHDMTHDANEGEHSGSDSSDSSEHIESPKPSKAAPTNLLQLPVSASHFASSSAGSVASSSSASSLAPTPASSTSTSASTTPISSISLMDMNMGPRS